MDNFQEQKIKMKLYIEYLMDKEDNDILVRGVKYATQNYDRLLLIETPSELKELESEMNQYVLFLNRIIDDYGGFEKYLQTPFIFS